MTGIALDTNFWETATLEQLDSLGIDQLLGQRISEIDFNRLIPSGTYILQFAGTKSIQESIRKKPATEDKKAQAVLNIPFKIVKVLAVADPNVDKAALVNRIHNQRFFLSNEGAVVQLAQLICGVTGIRQKDKEALATIGGALWTVLEQMREGKMIFGAKINFKSAGGYDNSDISYKEADFIDASKIGEYLD